MVRRPLDGMSEEQIRRRFEKRQATIDVLRATAKYARHLENPLSRARTPDPQDRTIGKHLWEVRVGEFRRALKFNLPAR